MENKDDLYYNKHQYANMPAISVLMPNYNYAPYLKEAIESILCQTFSDFELILIDDGSTDESVSIVESYARQDKRIRFYRNEKHIGLTAMLNKGIDLCEGEYLARMDSDDIAVPNRLEKQKDFLKLKNLDICGGNVVFFDGTTKYGIFTCPQTNEEIIAHLPFGCPIIHSTVMGKTSLFKKYYYRDFPRAEDWDLWLRMIADGVKIENISDMILWYRKQRYKTNKHLYSDTAISNLQLRALEIIGIPCTPQERELHYRILQVNQLRGSMELFNVLLWLRKLKRFISHNKPSKWTTRLYRQRFRLIIEMNSDRCRVGWLLYSVVKKLYPQIQKH